MRKGFLILLGGGVLTVLLLASYQPASVVGLDSPERLILYSIDGRPILPDSARARESLSNEEFHGYPVLGKVEITDADKRKEVADAIKTGLARSDGSMAACFWPRHAIRAVESNRIIDFVICFECSQSQIHNESSMNVKPTTRAPQAVLNRFLNESGVPLAPGMVE